MSLGVKNGARAPCSCQNAPCGSSRGCVTSSWDGDGEEIAATQGNNPDQRRLGERRVQGRVTKKRQKHSIQVLSEKLQTSWKEFPVTASRNGVWEVLFNSLCLLLSSSDSLSLFLFPAFRESTTNFYRRRNSRNSGAVSPVCSSSGV